MDRQGPPVAVSSAADRAGVYILQLPGICLLCLVSVYRPRIQLSVLKFPSPPPPRSSITTIIHLQCLISGFPHPPDVQFRVRGRQRSRSHIWFKSAGPSDGRKFRLKTDVLRYVPIYLGQVRHDSGCFPAGCFPGCFPAALVAAVITPPALLLALAA
jgi:hypothetical protein